MDFASFTRVLTEKQSYLWAAALTGGIFLALLKTGYADGLEKGVVTGIIAGAVFAVCLLVCGGVGWGIERVQRVRKARSKEAAANAAALKVFGDLFSEHRQVLEYIATEIGKPHFKAGAERVLLKMLELDLLEVDGPGGLSSSGMYYKVRDVVWKKMVEDGWLERKRWPEDEPEPWNENWRI